MRLCLRAFRHPPAPRKVAPRIPRIYVPRRALSSTPIQWSRASRKEEDEEDVDDLEDDGSVDVAEMERSLRAALRDPEFEASTRIQEQMLNNANSIMSNAQRVPKLKRPFWHDEEEDTDLITDERNEDEFDEDDIMSMAHGKLEEYREHREYARIAAWEMPLLSSECSHVASRLRSHLLTRKIRAGTALRTTHSSGTLAIPIHELYG